MKENTVWMHGQVYQTPKMFVNSEKEPIKIRFTLRIIRRLKSLNGMKEEAVRLDYANVIVENKEMLKYCMDNIREGDMVDIKGVFTTRNVTKKSICTCGHVNEYPGVYNYITPLYVCVREKGLSNRDGLDLLFERNEISNNVYAIGTVVSDVVYYEDDIQKYSQYQIKLGRKFWIKTDPIDLKDDYPHVKSYGVLGVRDKAFLHAGSHIYITGSVCTRNFKRRRICEHCGSEYEFDDSTMEIHSYSVEYLDREEVSDEIEDMDESGLTEENII